MYRHRRLLSRKKRTAPALRIYLKLAVLRVTMSTVEKKRNKLGQTAENDLDHGNIGGGYGGIIQRGNQPIIIIIDNNKHNSRMHLVEHVQNASPQSH